MLLCTPHQASLPTTVLGPPAHCPTYLPTTQVYYTPLAEDGTRDGTGRRQRDVSNLLACPPPHVACVHRSSLTTLGR